MSSYHFVAFVPDRPAIAAFTSWEGPVGRWTERLAKETVFRIKALANKRSGAMAAGMHYKKGKWSRGIQFEAGSEVPYTLYVDQGTKAHKIRAKNAPYLVFFWPKVGRVVHFKSVNHPGNRAYRFLERGLERALRFSERA